MTMTRKVPRPQPPIVRTPDRDPNHPSSGPGWPNLRSSSVKLQLWPKKPCTCRRNVCLTHEASQAAAQGVRTAELEAREAKKVVHRQGELVNGMAQIATGGGTTAEEASLGAVHQQCRSGDPPVAIKTPRRGKFRLRVRRIYITPKNGLARNDKKRSRPLMEDGQTV